MFICLIVTIYYINSILTNTSILNNIINLNSLAKRFSAKEAFAKALGCGIGKIGFQDIEILNNELKEPYININNKIKKYIKMQYNYDNLKISLSLSDDKEYCIASVIIYMYE